MNKKEIEVSIAAMRLDVVVGAGFGCSRSKAAQMIKDGLISLGGNIKKDTAIISEVYELFASLRQTWQEAMKIGNKENA